ncbi:MAG: hypothetical protein ACI8P0_005875 [Planctomycetaceae bacterium]|jgi:hypothetical protein
MNVHFTALQIVEANALLIKGSDAEQRRYWFGEL